MTSTPESRFQLPKLGHRNLVGEVKSKEENHPRFLRIDNLTRSRIKRTHTRFISIEDRSLSPTSYTQKHISFWIIFYRNLYYYCNTLLLLYHFAILNLHYYTTTLYYLGRWHHASALSPPSLSLPLLSSSSSSLLSSDSSERRAQVAPWPWWRPARLGRTPWSCQKSSRMGTVTPLIWGIKFLSKYLPKFRCYSCLSLISLFSF